jgi:hypothetical protein
MQSSSKAVRFNQRHRKVATIGAGKDTMICINLSETEPVMKAKTKTEETQSAGGEAQELPTEYLCIEPREEPLVFDWLNGIGNEANGEIAEVHLRLCFRCQEKVVHLMKIDEEFKKNAGRSLHLASSRNERRLNGPHPVDEDTDHFNPSQSMKAGGGN